ncbi:hypothetical protein [Nocardia cyriacigeorgica]|uniref:hypothetical protein n=1 Tax=Nocardia cyriacigeorgica TaxID=135487 RepID=UPI002457D375|nr:hypothetical protein [Nocardia cyriacigeorgica]
MQETVRILLEKLEQLITKVVMSMVPYGDGPLDVVKGVLKKTPGVGWVWNGIEIGKAFLDFYNEAKPVLDSMETLLNDTKTFIDALKNPQEFAQQKLEDKLAPIRENIDKVESGIELGNDVVTVGQTSRVTEAPSSKYSVGTGTQPWENQK